MPHTQSNDSCLLGSQQVTLDVGELSSALVANVSLLYFQQYDGSKSCWPMFDSVSYTEADGR